MADGCVLETGVFAGDAPAAAAGDAVASLGQRQRRKDRETETQRDSQIDSHGLSDELTDVSW